MPRKIVIFGNGLGMSLDPHEYSLAHAIDCVWDAPDILSQENKELIRYCIPDNHLDRPREEDDLGQLQLALAACEFLDKIPVREIHWLSEEGRLFPQAVRKFIHNTALQFHDTRRTLPPDFMDPFMEFIGHTESHIATLNYDNLLYQPMIESGLLRGYDGVLVDGLPDIGFHPENLERKFDRTFGYYLHLHGSPLFVDREGVIIKLRQNEVARQEDTTSSHIVLTHIKYKPAVISASNVLTAYWRTLVKAITESEEILLFGYSGRDDHLNLIIKNSPEIPIRVIEWEGAARDRKKREDNWSQLMARNVNLVRRENILDFQDWN